MNTPNTGLAPTPFTFKNQQVRTLDDQGQAWFVAADVAGALEYKNTHLMTRWLDDDEKGAHNVRTLGGVQKHTTINESGLYSAILRSRKPEAKRFKKWVTTEVLPVIRRTGRYETPRPTQPTEPLGLDPANIAATINALLHKHPGGDRKANRASIGFGYQGNRRWG